MSGQSAWQLARSGHHSPSIAPARENWLENAICALPGLDPEWWFGDADDVRLAKSYCKQCPVRDQCLQVAIDQRLDYGVFGGTTETERKRMRRNEQRRAAA